MILLLLTTLAPKARLPLQSDIQLATLRKWRNVCSANVCLLPTTRLAVARLSVIANADVFQQSMSSCLRVLCTICMSGGDTSSHTVPLIAIKMHLALSCE